MIGCPAAHSHLLSAWLHVLPHVNPQAFDLAPLLFCLPLNRVPCRGWFDYLLATRRKFDAIVVDAFHGGA